MQINGLNWVEKKPYPRLSQCKKIFFSNEPIFWYMQFCKGNKDTNFYQDWMGGWRNRQGRERERGKERSGERRQGKVEKTWHKRQLVSSHIPWSTSAETFPIKHPKRGECGQQKGLAYNQDAIFLTINAPRTVTYFNKPLFSLFICFSEGTRTMRKSVMTVRQACLSGHSMTDEYRYAHARTHAHKHTHTHTHTLLFFSSVRMAVIDWWNGPLSLVVIFFALCLLLLTWSIAGVACRACHSSGTFFHCDTHTHTHARTHAHTHTHTHTLTRTCRVLPAFFFHFVVC